MDTILIPTHFADNEKKLMNFGVYLSRKLEANMILYCPVEVPQPHFIQGAYELTEAMEENFREEKNKILNTYTRWLNELKSVFQDSFSIDLEIDKGTFVPGLIRRAERLNPGMIVMQSNKDGLIEKITGDSNEHILEKVDCPVLFVPEEKSPVEIKTIAYLTSYENEHLEQLKEFSSFTQKLDASLFIFHPKGDDENKYDLMKEGYINKIRLIEKEIEITHVSVDEKNKEDEFIDQIPKQNIDLAVFFDEKRNILKQLLSEKLSERILAQLKIPILVYPEQK